MQHVKRAGIPFWSSASCEQLSREVAYRLDSVVLHTLIAGQLTGHCQCSTQRDRSKKASSRKFARTGLEATSGYSLR